MDKMVFLPLLIVITFVVLYLVVNSFMDDNQQTNIPQDIFISFTTTPKRISETKPCIDSLLQQEIVLKDGTVYQPKIILSIPKKFRNKDPYTIPDWMPELVKETNGRFQVWNLSKDYGPATKLVGIYKYLKQRKTEGFIIYLDDDILYPKEMLQVLYNKASQHPKNAWCVRVGKPPQTLREIITQDIKHKDYYYPMGSNGVMIHSSLLQDDFESFVDIMNRSIDCYLSDDIVFGKYFNIKGIELKTTYNYGKYSPWMMKFANFPYGNGEDALHLGAKITENDFHRKKYLRCCNYIDNII